METTPREHGRELNIKLEHIRELLARRNLDAILLYQAGNVAWATCGADSHVNTAESAGIASLLITRTTRFLVTNNIEAARLMEEEGLSNQGWELSAVPWFEAENQIPELTAGMKLGSDTPLPNALDISQDVAFIRSQLTAEEGERFRELGKACAQAMRQAVESVEPGMTEYQIAGLLAQSAESRGVQAIVNLIAADERIFVYRHPLPTSRQLRNYAMLVLCGRRWGLICSITRLVHFGRLPDDVRRKGQAVAHIDATMISATRPGTTLGDVFTKAQLAYAATGFPDEWKYHHQGGSAGYAPREITARPTATEPIRLGQAFAWNPSISGAKSEDTILVGDCSNEILTQIADWPAINVQVDDQVIARPAILERV